MIYSLIAVTKELDNNTIEGYWVQDCVGSLAKAIGRAYATSMANGKQSIAVVEGLNSTVPQLNYWTNLKKLKLNEDEKQQNC